MLIERIIIIIKKHPGIISKSLGFVFITICGILMSHYQAPAPTSITVTPPFPEKKERLIPPKKSLTVYISGSIQSPGVYSLDAGARLFDLIHAAGDFIPGADSSNLNLARPLKDSEHINIPRLQTSSLTRSKSSPSISSNPQISLNQSTQKDFETLPGIGPKLARRIIDYRHQNGGFKTLQDLLKVKGIGTKQFKKLKPKLRL